MKFEVLLSCMFENSLEIVERSNLHCNVLIVNQCDANGYTEVRKENGQLIQKYDSTERGISNSRNFAIDKSIADIVLLSDDDEFFCNELESEVLEAYRKYPEADVIAFKIDREDKKYGENVKKLNRFTALKVSAIEISFKRETVTNKKIKFDNKFGPGCGISQSPGEENIFLQDCLKAGLKIYYVPIEIAMLRESESTWFEGYTDLYFYNRGRVTKRMLGFFWATVYAFYWCIMKKSLYKNDSSVWNALKCVLKGIVGKA